MRSITRKKTAIDEMLDARVVMAPMAGITDVPFRSMARKCGCRFAFTEMVDINGVVYNNRKTFSLLERHPEDEPLGVQLVGQDENKFLEVARRCVEMGYRVIDVNAGCPARKVVSPGKGSALLKDPEKLGRIISRLTKEIDIPITVKIRSGWDESSLNYLEVGRVVRDAGADAVCVHARTKEQMYKGRADHSVTGELKKAIDIPVFASGNIFSADDALGVLEETGCDGVFVARGCLGKPWIFGDIHDRLSGGAGLKLPGFEAKKALIEEHFMIAASYFDTSRLFSRMYKHIAWYLKGYKGLDQVMRVYTSDKTMEGFRSFIGRLYLDGRWLAVQG